MRLMSVFKATKQLIRDILMLFVIYMPGETGILIRRRYYKRRLKKCGVNFTVKPGVHLSGLAWIEVGDDVTIRENAVIQTGAPVPLEDERRSVKLVARDGSVGRGVVSLGDKCRIAHGVLILGYGGVRIGEKCGVGPGSVILSESFHYKGDDPSVIYKYSQGADLQEQCIIQGCVQFEDGAGVASQVVVLPGAEIGKDSWVLPHGVVRVGAQVPDFVIAKGDPAAVIKKRAMELSNAG